MATPATTDRRVLVLQQLAAAEAAQIARSTANGQRLAAPVLAGFTDWYAGAGVAQLAAQLLDIAGPVRDIAGQTGQAYMRELLSSLEVRVPTKAVKLPPPRRDADMTQVYSRPATTYRWTFATTGSDDQARAAAEERFVRLVQDDAMVAHRDAEEALMRAVQVKRYRRVIHPERSQSGTCGLCIAAAQRVYTIGTLMPVHGRCACTTAPILGTDDVGHLANTIDIADVYAAAGDSHDLGRSRFQVDEHGELGPVLTVKGEHFSGPGGRETSPAAAAEQLRALEPVLEDLQRRQRAGDDVTGPLRYQQAVIDKTRRIAAAAVPAAA